MVIEWWSDRCFAEPIAEAYHKAETLLKEWLSPEQLAQYEKTGHFEVIGSDTGQHYRIMRGSAMNIYRLDADGNASANLCFGPAACQTPGDAMLAQKIGLECNEAEVLKIANVVWDTANPIFSPSAAEVIPGDPNEPLGRYC